MNSLPKIIQGGMGAGVSSWRLANAVSQLGQLGIVSGTALDQILVRRLQDGDPGGHMRRGLGHFPLPTIAERLWNKYYVPGGKAAGAAYATLSMHTKENSRELNELCILANFLEIFLAREGHDNPVGINYLEKIQIPHLPSIYGAMLAGVGYVLMGAGVPLKIPGVLDLLASHNLATYPLHVIGTEIGHDTTMTFVPSEYMEGELGPLIRPKFLAIIASNTLATTMVKRANGKVDGFVIEGPTAGGHNAPPRGKMQLDEAGEPIYGERDRVDLAKIFELGLPFWLAGGFGSPEKFREALAAGAAGVQVGTAFAYCAESDMREDYKQAVLGKVVSGQIRVATDSLASPTGFPFKVAQMEGTLSDREVYEARKRICDLGFLREAYRTADGKIGYRCASEPVLGYVAKGGNEENTASRTCLCNALLATIGQPQIRSGEYVENGIVTSGDALTGIPQFLAPGQTSYHAADVVDRILNG